MRLAEFGIIGVDGIVNRPLTGEGFVDYQVILINYYEMLSLKRELAQRGLDQRQRPEQCAVTRGTVGA